VRDPEVGRLAAHVGGLRPRARRREHERDRGRGRRRPVERARRAGRRAALLRERRLDHRDVRARGVPLQRGRLAAARPVLERAAAGPVQVAGSSRTARRGRRSPGSRSPSCSRPTASRR
jgi:hypothetical protein